MTHDQLQLSLFSGPPLAGKSLAAKSLAGKPLAGKLEEVAVADPAAGQAATRKKSGQYSGQSRKLVVNPHLLAARRIARRMRRLPERSDAETRAGLAICAQLKAFLADETEANLSAPTAVPPARH